MVSHKELLNAGFEYAGIINNRSFYGRLGFNIMEHNGTAYIDGDYNQPLSTIAGVNQAFLNWANDRAKDLITIIAKAYTELELLKTVTQK